MVNLILLPDMGVRVCVCACVCVCVCVCTSFVQMVNLIQLPVEELRCFFINIFNVLVLHARITSKAHILKSRWIVSVYWTI